MLLLLLACSTPDSHPHAAGGSSEALIETSNRMFAALPEGSVEWGDFDRFLGGDSAALTPQAQAGLRVFLQAGCASCHSGPRLGDRQSGDGVDWIPGLRKPRTTTPRPGASSATAPADALNHAGTLEPDQIDAVRAFVSVL